jgi:hypothetical protein
MGWGWHSYDYGRERKNAVQEKIARMKKKGEAFEPVVVQGKGHKISSTFWGQAWCRHLEVHGDYDNRLPRGRSYLRQGNVYNLVIEPGVASATVAGSELYDTRVTISPMPAREWQALVKRCGGQVDSLLDLLAGKLGEETIRVLTDPADGLFPRKKQIKFNCSCPDWADMCKHVAAVLYGVGVMLDNRPELLFVLRDVDQNDLLGDARTAALADLDGSVAAGDLGGVDLSALFGIDLGDLPAVEEPTVPEKRYEELVIPSEAVIGLQIDNAVSSSTARVEDRVSARVTRDVRTGGLVAIPAGSRVQGSVVLVERGGKFKERARLGVRFHTVVLAGGETVPIQTETVYREGDSKSGQSAAKISGGAIGGAIIGAILGGGKGAIIGGATGAGAGTAAVAAGDRSEATLPAGTSVTARLSSPASVTVER